MRNKFSNQELKVLDKMKSYTINQFFGGIAKDKKLMQPYQFAHGENLDIYKEPSILRPQLDMATDETGATNAYIQAFCLTTDAAIYGVGAEDYGTVYTTTLYKKTLTGNWSSVLTGSNTLKLGTPLVEYNDYLYYWDGTQIHKYGPLSDSPSAASIGAPSNNVAGPMIEMGGKLYIAHDNDIASYDGSSWEDTALDLEGGWRIVSLAPWGKYLCIAAYKQAYNNVESRLFFWDLSETTWNFSVPCPNGKLQAVRNIGDRIRILTVMDAADSNMDGEIIISDWSGGTVRVQRKYKINGATDIDIYDNAVQERNNILYFGVHSSSANESWAGIYSYGQPIEGYPEAFMFDRYVGDTNIRAIRALLFAKTYCFVSYYKSSTTDYLVSRTNNALTFNDEGIYESRIFDFDKPFQNKQLKRITINTKPLGTNTTITIKLKNDRTASWSTVGTMTTAGEVQKSFYDLDGEIFSYFKEVQLQIGIKGSGTVSLYPEVTGITLFYDEIDIPA